MPDIKNCGILKKSEHMDTAFIENLLETQELKKIDMYGNFHTKASLDDTYYFFDNKYILLFQPYSPIIVKDKSLGFVDSYYLAYQNLYKKKCLIKTKLNEFGTLCNDFKGSYKQLVASMGFGKILRNTLLWSTIFGTYFAIEIITITNASYESHSIIVDIDKSCLHCMQCIKSCPTGALSKSGYIREKCIRQWQCDFLSPDSDKNKKKKLENKILGCNTCQICCPKNSINYQDHLSNEYKYFFDLDILAKNCIVKNEERSFYNNYLGKNYIRPLRLLSFSLNAMENDTANLLRHYDAIKQYEGISQTPAINALIKQYLFKWENIL